MKILKRKDSFTVVAVFIISLTIFASLIYFKIPTDIQDHAQMLVGFLNGTLPIPANPLYYLSVYALSFFQQNMSVLLAISIFILSLAVTLKFVITKKVFGDYIAGGAREIGQLDKFVALACFLLIFVFSLPSTGILRGWFYLGQTPPNVWHNSTTIFLMPFALLLFWTSYKQLTNPKNYRIWIIVLLVIANVLVKPNFFWVFSIVYPLLLIIRIGINARFWLNILPVILGLLLSGTLYYLFSHNGGGGGIIISPFLVWSHFSSNIPLSIVASIFFPLTFLSFYWKEMLRSLLLKYAILSYLVSILIFLTIAETGERQLHGNFSWQCMVSNYILFMVVFMLWLEKITSNGKLGKLAKKDKVIASSLIAHFIFGVAYLIKIFLSGSYA